MNVKTKTFYSLEQSTREDSSENWSGQPQLDKPLKKCLNARGWMGVWQKYRCLRLIEKNERSLRRALRSHESSNLNAGKAKFSEGDKSSGQWDLFLITRPKACVGCSHSPIGRADLMVLDCWFMQARTAG